MSRHFTPVQHAIQPLTRGRELEEWAIEQALTLRSDEDAPGMLIYARIHLGWSVRQWNTLIDSLCDLADEVSAAEMVADGPRLDAARVDYRDALAAIAAGAGAA